MSALMSSQLSPIEILAAALLIATAVLVLIATNARQRQLARHATYLGLATVAGALAAAFAAYAGDTFQPGKQRPTLAVTTGNSTARAHGEVIRDCENCPSVVVIPAGWFTIGASADDAGARPQELPARAIRVARDFAIGQTEVTVRQFEAFLVASRHPVPACWASNGGGSDAAATCVSWNDAVAYAKWLSAATGRAYRLPTAAEWEYAARAGSGLPYPVAGPISGSGSMPAGNLHRTSFQPQTAAAKPDGVSTANAGNTAVAGGTPNHYGLYDVNGGAAELTQDCWSETLSAIPADGSAHDIAGCSERVVKDGIWFEDATRARFSARRAIAAGKPVEGVGFRIVREINYGRQ
jgi:formylglycine-generating enzyme required for sulfatase activity